MDVKPTQNDQGKFSVINDKGKIIGWINASDRFIPKENNLGLDDLLSLAQFIHNSEKFSPVKSGVILD